jgi:hypothetical protein
VLISLLCVAVGAFAVLVKSALGDFNFPCSLKWSVPAEAKERLILAAKHIAIGQQSHHNDALFGLSNLFPKFRGDTNECLQFHGLIRPYDWGFDLGAWPTQWVQPVIWAIRKPSSPVECSHPDIGDDGWPFAEVTNGEHRHQYSLFWFPFSSSHLDSIAGSDQFGGLCIGMRADHARVLDEQIWALSIQRENRGFGAFVRSFRCGFSSDHHIAGDSYELQIKPSDQGGSDARDDRRDDDYRIAVSVALLLCGVLSAIWSVRHIDVCDWRWLVLGVLLAELGALTWLNGWPWAWTRSDTNERQQA